MCKECKNIFREFHSRKPKQDSPLLSSEGQSSDSSNLSPSLSGTMTPVKLQVTSSDPPSPMSMHSSSGERVLKSTRYVHVHAYNMYIFVFNWYMFASSFETGHNLTKKLSKLLFQKLWMQLCTYIRIGG